MYAAQCSCTDAYCLASLSAAKNCENVMPRRFVSRRASSFTDADIKKHIQAEKAASAQPTQATQKDAKPAGENAEDAEEELNPNQYFEIRLKAIQKLRAEGKAYPHKFEVGITVPEFIEKFHGLETGERLKDVITIAGMLQDCYTCY